MEGGYGDVIPIKLPQTTIIIIHALLMALLWTITQYGSTVYIGTAMGGSAL